MQAEIRLRPDGTGTIMLDGQDVSGSVGAFTLSARPGCGAGLRLEIPVLDGALFLEDVEPQLSPAVRQALIALGWTPPTETGEVSVERS